MKSSMENGTFFSRALTARFARWQQQPISTMFGLASLSLDMTPPRRPFITEQLSELKLVTLLNGMPALLKAYSNMSPIDSYRPYGNITWCWCSMLIGLV